MTYKDVIPHHLSYLGQIVWEILKNCQKPLFFENSRVMTYKDVILKDLKLN